MLARALIVQLYLLYVYEDAAIDTERHLIDHASFNSHKDTAAVLPNYHRSSNKRHPCGCLPL